jgi:hypothetical protein
VRNTAPRWSNAAPGYGSRVILAFSFQIASGAAGDLGAQLLDQCGEDGFGLCGSGIPWRGRIEPFADRYWLIR